MKTFFTRLLPRRTRKGLDWGVTSPVYVQYRSPTNISLKDVNVGFTFFSFGIRWPCSFQVSLFMNRYRQHCKLATHIDPHIEGERRIQIQVVLRNAERGGELRAERFVYNGRRVKIFNPYAYRHEVTEVEAGERFVLNFGLWFYPGSNRMPSTFVNR